MGDAILTRRGAADKGPAVNGSDVQVIAQDKIKIGDVVYTIDGDVRDTVNFINITDAVNCATFSPDGSVLILGGVFAGYAKVYSVSGNTLTYISDIYANSGTTALNNTVFFATFSPDGSVLILCGMFTGYAKVYSVSGTTVTYVREIYADSGTTALSNNSRCVVFSPNGSVLILGGVFAGYAKVYSVSGTTVTYVREIYANSGTTALNSLVTCATFSPNGSVLILGGGFTGCAKVYSVSGTTVTYVREIYANSGTTALSSTVNCTSLSSDGSVLILGGAFTGRAKVYSVSGTTVTYVREIYANSGTTALSSTVNCATFSPDGSVLILGGAFTGYAKVYSVSGTTVTYVREIYANSGTTALNSAVNCATFSANGSTLILGGAFTGYAKVYSVSGTTVTYVREIYANNGTTILSNAVNYATFSPNGSVLILGGVFAGYAKVYSVSGNTLTYISDIYANSGTTALNNVVDFATFSPDGSVLILGGAFTGYAKVYSVSGTTVTYVREIYADSGTTALNGTVCWAALSSNGSVLILGGAFTGYAKVYSVSGTTVTYVREIYANSGTTALNSTVYFAIFSPNGSTLILGGAFTGYAKVYSVSGTTVTYVREIYADSGTTALSSIALYATFSPNGSVLILGGSFTGYAKVYSVSGTTVTYVREIYADSGTTALSSTVTCATFSPNGSVLILGGSFTGYAKVYSVSGTTVTYVREIYADSGTTALSSGVRGATFSANGSVLILSGSFNGKSKLYSVSDDTVTYITFCYRVTKNGKLNYRYNMINYGIAKSDGNIGDTITITKTTNI